MDLVREEPEERLYDREAVLGRDAASVFPTETARAAKEAMSSAAEALGARNFITEKELEEIKRARGELPAEPVAADKPLAVVLAEQKQAKEDAFQAMWKQMKTGKNRPLDEDELEFLDAMDSRKRAAEQQWKQEQAQELDAFQEAIKRRAEREAKERSAASPAQPVKAEAQKAQPKPQPKRPLLGARIVRKAATSSGAAAATFSASSPATPTAAGEPPAKRQATGNSASGAAATGGSNGGTEAAVASESRQQDGSSTTAVQQGRSTSGALLGVDSRNAAAAAEADTRAKEVGEGEEEDAGLASLLGGYGSDSGDDT